MSKPRYPLNQSPLYCMRSKKRLASLLRVDLKDLQRLSCDLDNYRTFLLPEDVCQFTGAKKKERWVQQPKIQLRSIHSSLQRILMRIEPPAYVHGAVKGRSYRTNGLVHQGSSIVATFDIKKFYPFTSESRVYNFFRSMMQCSHDVSALLTSLCCVRGVSVGGKSALPTGSPLSPILSLYANVPLFDELNKLALSQSLIFSAYVDDITFSGKYLPVGFGHHVRQIVNKHGHILADTKTRIFRGAQGKHITGVVLRENSVRVPHFRFKKARLIQEALSSAKNSELQLSLTRKLAGLLGEAAYLDSRYAQWAQMIYIKLRLLS